jgi:hypothetical protein
VGEREAEDEGEEGVREEETSCKENRFVSGGGATSADSKAANCAPTTKPWRPADGDGNVACVTLGTEGKCGAVSSPLAGPGELTLSGTIAILRWSAPLSLARLCLYTGALPKESFFTFVPLGNGDEGDESFEARACRVLASSPTVSHIYGTAGCDAGVRSN